MRRKLYHTLIPWDKLKPRKKSLPKPAVPSSQQLSSSTAPTTSGNSTGTSSSSPLARRRRRPCRVYSITGGLVPYEDAWIWQQRLLHERMAWQRQDHHVEGHDVLLLLEHRSVYTLGRGSTLDNLRFNPADSICQHEVRRTDRGGEVTWHGPGQLIGYPVLDLNYHKKDLHWYLRQLEEVVIRVLARYGLKGEREAEHTGVWVEGAKIAAIGLNASRWITSHGFALNIHPDLAAFESIVPCGIHGRPVTRLCNYSHDLIHDLGKPPTSQLTARECAELVSTVREEVLHGFGRVFGLDMEILEIDVGVRRGVESQIFPEACDQRLRERLKADSRRQLELVRRR